MAVNNETGVITDLKSIENLIQTSGSATRWLVDGVQALGKIPISLKDSKIDYMCFSGHKLYAPKGVGLLYVRETAPVCASFIGGGQESNLRSGTENLSGIMAFGKIFEALQDNEIFHSTEVLQSYRCKIVECLKQAFPDIVFNAPFESSIPTTINFSVPGFESKEIMDLFDAANLRVSAGSACSSKKAKPSHVLVAMGLEEWRCRSAIRLSFGTAEELAIIEEACRRILKCGIALRKSCMIESSLDPEIEDGVVRFFSAGACCWAVLNSQSKKAIVIDPLPELQTRIVQFLNCRRYTVAAVVDTHSHADHESCRHSLVDELCKLSLMSKTNSDVNGWGFGFEKIKFKKNELECIRMGDKYFAKLATPGHTSDSVSFLLIKNSGLSETQQSVQFAFVGDTIMPNAIGRTDFATSNPAELFSSIKLLSEVLDSESLICSAHDYENQFATSLATEAKNQPMVRELLGHDMNSSRFSDLKMKLDSEIVNTEFQTMACGASIAKDQKCDKALQAISSSDLNDFSRRNPNALIVDVREKYEQEVGETLKIEVKHLEMMPLSRIVNGFSEWIKPNNIDKPILFYCRSGNRSFQAASSLSQLGHKNIFHLAGGLALNVH